MVIRRDKAETGRNIVIIVRIFIRIIIIKLVIIIFIFTTICSLLIVFITLLEDLWTELDLLYLSREMPVGVSLLVCGQKEDSHLLGVAWSPVVGTGCSIVILRGRTCALGLVAPETSI